MKFHCPSCSAKYQIPDEKLTGRLAKMKCRKCGSIIPIVAGPSKKSVAAAPVVQAMSVPPSIAQRTEAPAPPSIPSSSEPSEWHAGVNGAPVGPMTRSELAHRIAIGEVTAATYIWRESMDGWKVLPEVAELSALLTAPMVLPPPSMPPQAKAQKVAASPRPELRPVPQAAPAPAKTPAKAPQQEAPRQTPAPGSAQALAASFGLDIDSGRPPEIREANASAAAKLESETDSAVPAVTTEAPIPDIAMPSSVIDVGAPLSQGHRPSLFSVRPSYDSLIAELKRRRKSPWVVPFAVVAALVLGLTFGFVLFGDQETKIIKQVVEVPAKIAEASDEKKTAAAEAAAESSGLPEEEAKVEAAKTQNSVKTATSNGTSGTPTASSEKISQGLKGLSGLDGLGGPASGPSVGTGSSNGQPLEASQIQSTVTQYQSSVKRGCWQPALMSRDRDAPSTARVTVTMGVGADGSVNSVSSSGDPRGYPGLSSCILTRVRSWRFPRSGGSTTVNVPFVFAAQ